MSGYNYSLPGIYHIVICVSSKMYDDYPDRNVFGYIADGKMILNDYGFICDKYLSQIPSIYKNTKLHIYQIMPNHIHILIEILDKGDCVVGIEQCSVPTDKTRVNFGRLSKIIKSFKEIVTKTIRNKFGDFGFAWQRSFYDHIIHNYEAFETIKHYIIENPINWESDRNYKYSSFLIRITQFRETHLS